MMSVLSTGNVRRTFEMMDQDKWGGVVGLHKFATSDAYSTVGYPAVDVDCRPIIPHGEVDGGTDFADLEW